MYYIIGHKNPDTDATVSPIILAEILKITKGITATALLQGEPNKEALFVLKHFAVDMPTFYTKFTEDDTVFIVDTTNPSELPEDLAAANVMGVFDHHKLGGLKTNAPLMAYIMPLGSTSTVLLDYLIHHTDKTLTDLDRPVLGLALSGIISDTLNLRSPTTTETDRKYYQQLADILKIDPDSLANDMFAAKSDISDLSAEDIITYDAKEYEFSKGKTHIAVFETVDISPILKRYDELAKALKEFRRKQNLFQVFLFVIDILNQDAYFIKYCKRAEAYIKKAFADAIVEETDQYIKLQGIVSRKKQIVPPLEKIL